MALIFSKAAPNADIDATKANEPQFENRATTRRITLQFIALGITSWFVYFSVYAVRHYIAAFLIPYAKDTNLNVTYCNMAAATFMISTFFTPFLVDRLGLFKEYHLKTRASFYGVFIASANLLSILMDYLPQWDSSGGSVYVLLSILRFLEGAGVGCLFVIMQGEIVDVCWKGNGLVVGIISSSMHLPPLFGGALSAAFYKWNSWSASAPVFSFFVIVPVIVLSFLDIDTITLESDALNMTKTAEPIQHEQESDGASKELTNDAEKAVHNRHDAGSVQHMDLNITKTSCADEHDGSLSLRQKVIFLLPDIVVFLNNTWFVVLIYSIPYRITERSSYSLPHANQLLGIMSATSLIVTVVLSYIATCQIATTLVMIAGNVSFYIGVVLIYGSTTDFFVFRGSFEMGVLLAGIGDAGVTNLCIPSKFEMVQKWGKNDSHIGTMSTMYFNAALAAASVVGITLSGLTITPESELPTVVISGAMSVVTSITMILTQIFK